MRYSSRHFSQNVCPQKAMTLLHRNSEHRGQIKCWCSFSSSASSTISSCSSAFSLFCLIIWNTSCYRLNSFSFAIASSVKSPGFEGELSWSTCSLACCFPVSLALRRPKRESLGCFSSLEITFRSLGTTLQGASSAFWRGASSTSSSGSSTLLNSYLLFLPQRKRPRI